MKLNDYQSLAIRTAKPGDTEQDLIHAALGLTGEAGEFADAVKKSVVYGRPLDTAHLIEEIGDALWYVALACRALDVDLATVAEGNIAKLRVRYPERYTDDLAAARLDKAG